MITVDRITVHFELDAKRVVDYYNKGKDDVSEFGTIIECKRCCQVYYKNSQFEFNRRQANEVDHTLAREVHSYLIPIVPLKYRLVS